MAATSGHPVEDRNYTEALRDLIWEKLGKKTRWRIIKFQFFSAIK
jgi:hypothetical protein